MIYKPSKRFNLKKFKKTMTKKITYKKALQQYINIGKLASKKRDKLAFGVETIVEPSLAKAVEKYNIAVGKINLDNALEIDGELKMEADGKTYKYSKEAKRKVDIELEKLGEQEVEIDIFIAPINQRIKDLHYSFKELYNGILWEMVLPTEADYNEDEVPATAEA